MNHFIAILIFILLLVSCRQSTDPATPITITPVSTTPVAGTTVVVTPLPWVSYTVDDIRADTTLFSAPQAIGELTDAALVEASGLAASRANAGYVWTEEDSGNPNQIQLLSRDGNVVARYTIEGSENRDWEDMTVGPGPVPGQPYVYVADIGDNKLRYPEKVVYRFPEPVLTGKTLPYTGTVSGAEALRFTLPDGAKNAEAILLDGASLDLYILSKEAYSAVYKASYPQSLTQATAMQRVVTMPFDNVTSAALSPDGREILVRTYGQLFYYPRQAGEPVGDALKRVPRLLPLANENKGEAVGWAIDGSAYYTTSEKTDAAFPKLYQYTRKKH